jgi:hypothetical protein
MFNTLHTINGKKTGPDPGIFGGGGGGGLMLQDQTPFLKGVCPGKNEIYMLNGGFCCILGAHFEMEVSIYFFHKNSDLINFGFKLHVIFAKVEDKKKTSC